MKEKEGWEGLTLKWHHKDGSVRYLESTCRPNFDGEGNLTGFSGLDRDITGEKEAEAAQFDYQDRLRSIARIGAMANSSLNSRWFWIAS